MKKRSQFLLRLLLCLRCSSAAWVAVAAAREVQENAPSVRRQLRTHTKVLGTVIRTTGTQSLGQ